MADAHRAAVGRLGRLALGPASTYTVKKLMHKYSKGVTKTWRYRINELWRNYKNLMEELSFPTFGTFGKCSVCNSVIFWFFKQCMWEGAEVILSFCPVGNQNLLGHAFDNIWKGHLLYGCDKKCLLHIFID